MKKLKHKVKRLFMCDHAKQCGRGCEHALPHLPEYTCDNIHGHYHCVHARATTICREILKI